MILNETTKDLTFLYFVLLTNQKFFLATRKGILVQYNGFEVGAGRLQLSLHLHPALRVGVVLHDVRRLLLPVKEPLSCPATRQSDGVSIDQ